MAQNKELLDAVLSSNLGLVISLTKAVDDVNYIIDGTDGLTMLHVVAGITSIKSALIALHLMKNKKADPNYRSYDDITPVHISTMWDNFLVLEKLLSFGGDPFITDYNGKNAFELANDNESKECLKLLQIFKANLRKNALFSGGTNALYGTDCLYHINASPHKSPNAKEEKKSDEIPLNSSTTKTDQCDEIAELLGKITLSKKAQKLINYEKTRKWIYEGSVSGSPGPSGYIPILSDEKAKALSKVSSGRYSSIRDTKLISAPVKPDYIEGSIRSSFSDGDDTIIDKTNYVSEVETTYTDEEEGITLVEKHSMPVPCEALSDVCSESTDWSDWKSFRTACSHLSGQDSTRSCKPVSVPSDIFNLNNSEIFSQLKGLGDNPGPVMDYTRPVYLQRLTKLKWGLATTPPKQKYPPEIYMFLGDGLNLQRMQQLEQELVNDFEEGSKYHEYREGNQRCSFNYFLLDPRVTQNLPLRIRSMSYKEAFTIFLDSLFYVGKGTRGRPYSHLFESVKAMDLPQNAKHSEKVQHIIDIWRSGLGVISLTCFQNSMPVEAYTREACIIEAIGLHNLTNIKKGNFYGVSASWTLCKKRQLGVLFLSRALDIFLLEGERIIRPKDIAKKS